MNPLTIALVVGIGYLLLRSNVAGASPLAATTAQPGMTAAQLAQLMAQNAKQQQQKGGGAGGGVSGGGGGAGVPKQVGAAPVGAGLVGTTGFTPAQLAAFGYTPQDIQNFATGAVIPQETVLGEGLSMPTGISPGPSSYLLPSQPDVSAPVDVFGPAPSTADIVAGYADPFSNVPSMVPLPPSYDVYGMGGTDQTGFEFSDGGSSLDYSSLDTASFGG